MCDRSSVVGMAELCCIEFFGDVSCSTEFTIQKNAEVVAKIVELRTRGKLSTTRTSRSKLIDLEQLIFVVLILIQFAG